MSRGGGIYQFLRAHIAMMTGFSPGTIAAPLHIFRAEESLRQAPRQIDWLAHAGAPSASTQQTLPGSHENIILLDENVRHIAQVLSCVHPRQAAALP